MVQKPCCPASAARMVKRVNISGFVVGIAQMDEIMNEVYGMNLDDTRKIREELLRLVKIYNYVPSGSEDEYADAILEEYKKYCKEKVK